MEPYKFIALEIDLVLVLGDIVIPDLRWVVRGSLAGRVRWVPGGRPMRASTGSQEMISIPYCANIGSVVTTGMWCTWAAAIIIRSHGSA